MERYRTIAATPVRTASEAWRTGVSLISDTLERSSSIPNGSVADELQPLDGLVPALIAAGHLEEKGLVVLADDLRLTIKFATADAAFAVDENLNPVPGGASATSSWMIYFPQVEHLSDALIAAAKKSTHISTDEPPSSATKEAAGSRASTGVIDLDALRRHGENQ